MGRRPLGKSCHLGVAPPHTGNRTKDVQGNGMRQVWQQSASSILVSA